MFKDHLLKGKRILITGGGTGLGREIAARYLELGADLWIAGRRGGVLEDAARELTTKHGGRVRIQAVDIRDAAAGRGLGSPNLGEERALHRLVKNAPRHFI